MNSVTFRFTFVLAVMLAAAAVPIQAANYFSFSDGDWSTPGTWTTDGANPAASVPTASDGAHISDAFGGPGGDTVAVTSNGMVAQKVEVGWNGTGTLNVSGGTLTLSDWLGAGTSGTGTVNQTGGTVTAGTTVSSTGLSISRWGISGPNPNGLGSGGGTYNVSGSAVLSVNGNLENSNSTSVIGTGTFRITGDAASISVSNNFLQANDGTLAVVLNSNNFSTINVTGNATLAGVLDVSLTGGYSPSGFRIWDVLAAGGTLTQSLILNAPSADWHIRQSGNTLQVSVPEPAGISLLALAAVPMMKRRRA